MLAFDSQSGALIGRYTVSQGEKHAFGDLTLVAIQNGTAPERLIMLRLSDTLDRVVSWRVLLARAPGLGDPTHGCLYHGEFSFIANSGWDQFRDNGERDPKVTPQPPEIWKIRLPPTSAVHSGS